MSGVVGAVYSWLPKQSTQNTYRQVAIAFATRNEQVTGKGKVTGRPLQAMDTITLADA